MSTAHIVALPGFVTIIRIVQLVLTILVMALVGHTIDGAGKGAAPLVSELSFMIFVCVWTLLVNAYLLATPLFLPVAYNMWAHLALEIVSWIFWLSGFAATASWASTYSFLSSATGTIYAYWATSAAGAAMGAINWILFSITLVFFCLRLHAHRSDPNNAHLNELGLPEKSETHQMGAVGGVQQPSAAPTPYPQGAPDMAPTPVQYAATPPPQQWQQSPPPPGQQQY